MEKITAVLPQLYPVPGDQAGNLDRMEAVIEKGLAAGGRLFCFPECSLTGYTVTAPARYALASDDPAVQRFCHLAEEKNILLSFGFLEKAGDRLYISQLLAGPESHVLYRKTHLGSREQAVFAAGEAFPVLSAFGLTVGLCLCWETHIPEIAGICRSRGCDVFLAPYASGMAGERCKSLWQKHLPARASDNGMYVLAVNGLTAASGKRGGGLAVYDPKGELAAEYFGPEEEILLCPLSGPLPREGKQDDMHNISYFDRRRPELYKKWLP